MKLAILLWLAATTFAWAAPHTPEPGSAERKAICDAVRAHVIRHVASRKLPRPIVFKIDVIRVENGFAWFEGFPMFEGTSEVPTEYLPDYDYAMTLRKGKSGWTVTNDLSRSDVPSDEEATVIRKKIREFPASIIPASWRQMLKL